jgi:hypothetical protein
VVATPADDDLPPPPKKVKGFVNEAREAKRTFMMGLTFFSHQLEKQQRKGDCERERRGGGFGFGCGQMIEGDGRENRIRAGTYARASRP